MRALIVLVALAGVAAASATASAQRLTAQIEFVERELSRRCALGGESRGDLGGATPPTTGCQIEVDVGQLSLSIRARPNRRAAEDAPLQRIDTEIAFGPDAFFYCARPDRDGFSSLYMNCLGLQTLTGPRCVTRTDADGAVHRRSFALILSMPRDACQEISGALSFIAERSDPL